MDAAKDDVFGVRVARCGLRQFKGVTGDVREVDNFIALVVVSQNHD